MEIWTIKVSFSRDVAKILFFFFLVERFRFLYSSSDYASSCFLWKDNSYSHLFSWIEPTKGKKSNPDFGNHFTTSLRCHPSAWDLDCLVGVNGLLLPRKKLKGEIVHLCMVHPEYKSLILSVILLLRQAGFSLLFIALLVNEFKILLTIQQLF